MAPDEQRATPLERRLETAARGVEPVIHPETEGFWAAIAEGELRVQRCSRCSTYRFPLAPVCFNCRCFESSWEPLAPEGTVAAAVLVHRATGDPSWGAFTPFISGLVDLEHGLRLTARIACHCGRALERGTRVRAIVFTAPGCVPVNGFAHSCPAGDG